MSDDKSPDNLRVPATKEDKSFKRPNSMVPIRVESGGTLTLLSRKVLNTVLMHTQRQGDPGQNAPPDELGESINQNFYWTPLCEFVADARFNSNDVEALRAAFLNLQDIRLARDTATRLSTPVLIADYQIKNPTGKKGSRVWVGWELPSAVREIAKRPDIYTKASLHYLNILQTTAGIALYEIAKRYATSDSRLTMKESVDWWYATLCGLPIDSKVKEYKYFKRDVILTAIAEVNALTDITIDKDGGGIIEFRESRRVVALQFRVQMKAQGQLDLSRPVINTDLVQQIADLGMSMRDAENIFSTHAEDLIRDTLRLVADRANNSALEPLASLAAFFRAALKGKYTANKPKPPAKAVPPPRPPEPEPDPALAAARNEALALFDALGKEEQASRLAEFIAANPYLASQARKNPASPLIRKPLAGWLIKRIEG